jgi:alpha-beta hydrolase superfamily lysophospholipase
MRPILAWATTHPYKTLALLALTAFALLNVLAYRHARAMTHFVPRGRPWEGKPEGLSLFAKVRALFGGVAIARPANESLPGDLGLVGDVHSYPGEVGRLEAWYVPRPRPKGIVLLFHGFTSCKARLLPEARAFHDLGYACFLVDFRGSGGSAGDATTIGYREADDVARSVAYVREKWPAQRLVLFGHSMGAAAVLRALADFDVKADAIVLECPFDRLLTTVKARFGAMGVPAFPSAQLLVFWGGRQHGFNGFRHNPIDYARKVTCPVLLMHGENDPRVSAAHVEAIYEALGGEKRSYVFTGLGHESYAAPRPQEWKQQVGTFLGERGAGLSQRKALTGGSCGP